jgi:hypothetical protein
LTHDLGALARVAWPHVIRQKVTAVAACGGRGCSPNGRQEAEIKEVSRDQVQPSKAPPKWSASSN